MRKFRLNTFFGPIDFYKTIIAIAIPILIQSGVTQLVSLVDNIMIGAVGTLPMSGVSISSQLINIFTLTCFGCVNAAGIYGAQFAGKKDYQGIKNCFIFKIILSVLVAVVFIIIFSLFGKPLILSYLDSAENTAEEISITLSYATQYLDVMFIGLIPFSINQAISSTLRENKETVIPMIGSTIALFLNAILNYLLIFGKFGFPQLGIVGAAIATNISRFVELGVMIIVAKKRSELLKTIGNPFKNISLTLDLVNRIVLRGAPLVINEIIWSAYLAGVNQCYSSRSLIAVASITIVSSVFNLYTIICNSLGISTGIIVGQSLGNGDKEEAFVTDIRMITFNIILSGTFGLIFYFISPLFPQFYNTTDEIKNIAAIMLQITSLKLPIQAIYISSYFTLRCGGRTLITFLFDCMFSACLCWPLAFFLAHYTNVSLITMFLLVNLLDVLKAIIGLVLVWNGIWLVSLVND